MPARKGPPTHVLSKGSSEGGGGCVKNALRCSKRKTEGMFGQSKPSDSRFKRGRVVVEPGKVEGR